ncbi:MAG: serine hydrolase domain-containing protein [Caulobacteraceae bacterium]
MRKFFWLAAAALISFPAIAQSAAPVTAASSLSPGVVGSAPGGGTYLLPSGWMKSVSSGVLTLSPPESDFHVAIVDAGPAVDGKAAAAAAWELYRPHAVHPFKLLTTRPPRNGWDEQAVVDYETSPSEHQVEQAIARRKGGSWVVSIIDGSEGTEEKRLAALEQILASLRPAGYARETFSGTQPHPLDQKGVQELVDFVRESAAKLRVPGVGLAVYSGGKVVYEGGVGVREIGKPDAVDAHTLFMIASNTKSMSTLLLAELVSDGKIRWDEPVTQVYPAFRLGNEDITRSVEIRHLVCACTGLPRKDQEWIFNTTSKTPATNTFDLLAATTPTSRFGEVFQYNNLLAAAGGYVAAHVYYPGMELGQAYDRAIMEHVWRPLGMTDSTMSMDEALVRNHASPHGDDLSGKPAVEPQDLNRAVKSNRPAGGAWSSPHDMILYMRNELTEGILPDGKPLLAKDALLARRARGVPVGEDQWYGMGLMEDATWGVSVIHHGGDLIGYHSDIYAIPSAGVAAVLLTNGDNGYALLRPFMRRLLEILYDGHIEAQDDVDAAVKRIDAEEVELRSHLQMPADQSVLDSLAPIYSSPELGTLRLRRHASELQIFSKAWSNTVTTRRNLDGTISLISINPGWLDDNENEFVIGKVGGKRTLTVRDAQHVYIFTEVVQREARTTKSVRG